MNHYIVAFLLASAGTASAQQLSMPQKMELRDNCKQDVKQLCPNAKPGEGALMACIRENKAKLSNTCTATIEKLMTNKN